MRLTSGVAILCASLWGASATAAPRVVADLAPIHSIAARVMLGVAEPALLLPPGASPHGYAMRPSEAEALAEADVVVWVGPGLTPWLAEAIGALAPQATSLAMRDAPGVLLLPARTGPRFGGGHDHDHADEHHGHAADDGRDHAQGAVDEHIWLDPANGAAFATALAETLSARDPANATAYRENAAAFAGEVGAASARIAARLTPVADRPFLVFHDAYQYFEARFGLRDVGAITLSDASPPSAARLSQAQAALSESGARCVFREPQFSARLVDAVREGTDAQVATLDPLGATLPRGPGLYLDALEAMGDAIATCLGR
jgi:zinc transport system substrate-binding protein